MDHAAKIDVTGGHSKSLLVVGRTIPSPSGFGSHAAVPTAR